MSGGKHTPLAEVGRLAIQELTARKERAQARTLLSSLRRTYLEETGEFFDPKCHGGEEEDLAIVAAMKRREEANKALRLATSQLRRAIEKATRA